MPSLRRFTALALIVGVSACASPDASGTPVASPSPTPGTPAAGSDCAPIELKDPGGTHIVLSGTWRETGGGPVYYLYQDGDCLWYAGGFAASDGEQDWGKLGLFTIVFDGTVQADFTIPGRWAVVRMAGTSFAGNVWQDKTWTMEFEPSDTGYDVVLTSPPDDLAAVSATRLVKVSDEVVEP